MGAQVILLDWSKGGSYIYRDKNEPCSKKKMVLNSVSLQCALGKSSGARKSEVDPKTFKKCNASDFKF